MRRLWKQAKCFESGSVEEIVIDCVFEEVSKLDTFRDNSSGDDSLGEFKDHPDNDVEIIILVYWSEGGWL